MTHIMLDLETWGKTPGSDLRSIGAVVFDPVAGRVCDNAQTYTSDPSGKTDGSFYIATDNPVIHGEPWRIPQDGSEINPWKYKYPLTRDPETVQWWNDQSREAQAAFADPVDLKEALIQFADWLTEVTCPSFGTQYTVWVDPMPVHKRENVQIWSNGPQFDVSIMAAAFAAVGMREPWHYRAPRDFRTIVEAAGMTRDDMAAFSHGTHHNALDDAISQAMIVCEAYKRLGLQR